MKRAAVLIGVHDVKGMTKLHAVLDGIERMETWALDQDMDRKLVKTITDKNDEVRADHVEEAVIEIVKTDGLEQLIIYFAGHGVNVLYNEYWLLTHAINRSSQSVNVSGSTARAKNSGISHIVLLSDACRSSPTSLQQSTTGTIIFPDPPAGASRSWVDIFYATRLGEPSLEIKDTKAAAEKFRAAYTELLLEAVNGNHKDICELDTNLGEKVVRPWALNDFLERNVPDRVYELTDSFKVTQVPQAIITSRPDTAWISDISKVLPTRSNPFESTPRSTEVSDALREMQAANDLISEVIHNNAVNLPAAIERVRNFAASRQISRSADNKDFAIDLVEATEDVVETFGREHFETECGFKVRGARIIEVLGGENTEILPEQQAVRVFHDGQPRSILLVFDSGLGALLPAIPEFICSLFLKEGEEKSLCDVRYEPSTNGRRWDLFKNRVKEIRTLRAVAAAASKKGVFRLEGDSADMMARRMQMAKGIDPSLALYAAHAYHEQGNDRYLVQMTNYLRDDLGKIPLDIVLLAGRLNSINTATEDSIVPFLPMLSQTWALLPAYGVELPPGLETIQQHLVYSSLWSLYKPTGVEMIRQAFETGVVR